MIDPSNPTLSALAAAVDARNASVHDEIVALKADLERDVAIKIDKAVTSMKLWVISAVLTQVVAMLPVIFFLGGIYNTNADALASINKMQTVLEQRGGWMSERERFEQSIEQWAVPKGFTPPRYRNTTP